MIARPRPRTARVAGLALFAAACVFALACVGALAGSARAEDEGEAFARAAIFEFQAGRPDRAADLADQAIRAPASAGPAGQSGGLAGAARGGIPVAALRFLRAEALRAAGDDAGAAAERDALLRGAPASPWARALLDLCAIDGTSCGAGGGGATGAGGALEPSAALARGPLGVAATVAAGIRMANNAGRSANLAGVQAAERWGKPLESTEAAPFWLVVLAQTSLAAHDTAAAKSALERAVARAAPAGATDLVSEAALRRAALAYHQGKYDEALTWVARVTDEKGRALSCPGAILTGYVHYRLEHWKEAAQAFNYAQACAQDRGERGRLLALEARCRALSGERRLAAAVAGDAAQDLEAAARGEGIGQARLQDATDVLDRPLDLDVDRQRLVRGFFAAQAAKEGWLLASADAKGYAGFPFRVVRADDPAASDEFLRGRVARDSLSRVPKLAAQRASEAAADRANYVRMTQAELNAVTTALSSSAFAADSAAAGREVKDAAARLGERAATLTEAEASRLAGQARTLAAAARMRATLAEPAPGQREERYEALDRESLKREADLLDATADSLRARASREAKAWRGPFADAMAREQSDGLSRRRAAAAEERARAQAMLETTRRDLPLEDAQSRATSAAAVAARAAIEDSLLQASRGIGPQAEAAARTAVLRQRAQVDYEVALFERSAWAAIALDDGDSTEADLAPAIAASDEFLAKFPQSVYVPAAEFNRADLEVKKALAAARARGGVPNFAPAVARYERLLAGHPDYTRTDAVLFNLSVLARESGDDATADRRLAELLQRSPNGELAAEAHITLADRAFEAGRYDEAEGHYRAVATSRGRLTPMALYKQGYSALRRNDGTTATNAFAQLLAMPDVDSTVVNDAIAQLARALSVAGGAPAAERLFAATPGGQPPYARALLRTMADQEKEDGAFDRAGDAYRMLFERFPKDAGAMDAASDMIGAWDARGRDDERVKARLDAGRFIAPRDSLGAPMKAFGAHAMLEAASLEHERGRGGKDRAALERAVTDYRELAQIYPKYDSLALARTAEGEALFDLGRYAESATAHEKALASGAGTPGAAAAAASPAATELRREAAFGSALARERVARGNSYRAPADRDSLEHAIVRLEKNASAGDPRIPPLWLSLALGSQEVGDSTRARRVYEHVAGRDTSEASRRAQSELGRVALGERRWADAEKLYAAGAAAYLAAGDRAEEARLIELAASARFKQAEDLEAKHDTAGAAGAFRTLADQYPNFTRADVALYRAGLAALAARDPRRAEEQLATLLERYPKSSLYDDAALRRGEAQLAMGDSLSAARTYANARLDGPPESQALAIAAVEEAIEIYRATGAFSDAEATAAYLRKSAPDARARTRAQAALAVLAYDLGRRAQTWSLLAPWRATSLPADLAPDPDADAAARFVYGRILADSCLALPLAHPIQAALQRKLAVLGPALENLKAGAKTTASPHWAESGYYAGFLLDDLGARLEALPPPTKMSAEDSAGYRRAIGGQAATFFGRAEDLWIATLEGMTDASRDTTAARDTVATKPVAGWPGRIFERLEPRLLAHYPWRTSITDLPEAAATSGAIPDSAHGVAGAGLVADLEGGVAPAPPRDSSGVDAGASEDLRNRLQWIAQSLADGQIDAAAQWADAGVKSYPARAETWNDLGIVRMRQGRWSEALVAWRNALRRDPKSPGALYNRAVFERFYRLDREAARRDFERFLTLGVPFDEALADRMAEEKKP